MLKSLVYITSFIFFFISINLLNAQTAEELNSSGDEKFKLGEYESAIDFYTRALEIEPKSAELLDKRGIAYTKLKKLEKASSDILSAIKLSPENPKFNFDMGTIKALKREFFSSISYFDISIKYDSNNYLAYWLRGISKSKTSNYSGALQDYKNCILLNHNFEKVYLDVGSAWMDLGEFKNAIKAFDLYIEKLPEDPMGYVNRGAARNHLSDYEGALKDYEKAIELDPNCFAAYINRGTLNYGLKNYEDAIKDHTKAIELDPEFSTSYVNRGINKILINDIDGGCEDLKKGKELGNKNPLLFEYLNKYCKY